MKTDNYNELFLLFNNEIELLPNRIYEVGGEFLNKNFIENNRNSKVFFTIINEKSFDIIHNDIISNIENNKWIPLKMKIKLKNNVLEKNIRFGVSIISNLNFNLEGSFHISNIHYNGTDILVQDPLKQNLFIQNNFNKPFKGGVEKLRIYGEILTRNQILNNAKNENITFKISEGGRLIYINKYSETSTPTTTTKP